MSIARSEVLTAKLKSKGFDPAHVCEVGVYLPETCSVRNFIYEGKKASLVEANPVMVEKIKDAFKSYPLTTVFPFAIAEAPGMITLYNRGASTFIEKVESPALVNDQYTKVDADRFEVEAKTFDQIDDGEIDVLCIDIEGAEWFVLSNLVSRPKLISIETHGKYYTNPKLVEIRNWMKANEYRIWYKDKSDSVYVKKGAISVSISEIAKLRFYELILAMRRFKGYLIPRKRTFA